jgi:WD40-like Beta Propeller Repeat
MALFTIDAFAGGHASKVPGTKNLLGFDWSWTNCRVVLSEGLATRGGDSNGDLFATDPPLTRTTPLLKAGGRQSSPTWSPDGQQIAYLSGGGLWVVRADGSQPLQLVPRQKHWARDGGSTAAIHNADWQPAP